MGRPELLMILNAQTVLTVLTQTELSPSPNLAHSDAE
jgi:hypothetical protein